MKNKSKKKKLVLNVLIGMFSYIIITIAGLITQQTLTKVMGLQINGINGTLMSVMSMLSLTELGVGTAIVCHLYKPLATGDKRTTISLMQAYSKIYKAFALIVIVLGACLIPILPNLFKEQFDHSFLTKAFMLMVLDVAVSYMFAYKRAIIAADQKAFYVIIVTTISTVFMNLAKIGIIYFKRDYILFLIVSILFRAIDNLTVSYIANKMYPYIKTKEKIKLDPTIKRSIIVTVNAVAVHYVATYIINGSSNVVISTVIGTTIAGIYANYNKVLFAFKQFIAQSLSQGILPIFGVSLAESDKEKTHKMFMNTMFVNFLIINFIAISLLVCFNPFMKLWIGENALFDWIVVFLLVISFYIEGISETLSSLRAGAGLFSPDKWLQPLLAGLNLAIAIPLANKIGVAGVFVGTLVCYTIKNIVVLPNIVYKNIFNISVSFYYKKLALYILSTASFGVFTLYISNIFVNSNAVSDLFIKIIICLFVPNILAVLCYIKTQEFKYLMKNLKELKSKVFKKA